MPIPEVATRWQRFSSVMRDGRRHMRTFLGMHHCPLYVSLDYLVRDDPMLEVHRLSTRVAFRRKPRALRAGLIAAYLAAWPIRAVYLTCLYTSWYGRSVKDMSGKGLLKQSIEQLGLALRHTIPPYEYYAKELFEYAPDRQATDFIFDYELIRLYAYLNEDCDAQALSNKVVFHNFCRQEGLPTVPIIAEFVGGKMFSFGDKWGGLPCCDLFIKQTRGSKGIGAMRWEYVGADRYKSSDGAILTRSELMDFLKHRSHTAPYLVQPRVMTHPDIADLTTGAVVTARIVTARTSDGRIELLGSILKIPTGDMIADYYVDGLFSPIDQTNGTLGRASRLDFVWQKYDHHPDTGGKITDRRVPQWELAADLVRRAHTALHEFVFIGWDVAMAPEGPILLEGNHNPSAVLMERPSSKPLGRTRFPIICLEHARMKRAGSHSARRPHGDVVKGTTEPRWNPSPTRTGS